MRRHSESLLHIPLVQQMLEDPSVQFKSRAIDKSWHYFNKHSPSLGGFNPLTNTIYYGKYSRFSKWLKQTEKSARELNEGDHLVAEVLFAVHDYLHIWGYQAVAELLPNLGFGTNPITDKNFEDMVFCHLLTETVATVGLDYWYLSQLNLNDVVSIGTRIYPLTTHYHQKHIAEFQRFSKSFNPYKKEFFTQINNMYICGEFAGLDIKALQRSPLILNWMTHELKYAELQRRYTRSWLAHLSNLKIQLPLAQLSKPVNLDNKWKQQLTADLSFLLWNKVVKNERSFFPPLDLESVWQSKSERSDKISFQSTNINSLGLSPQQLRQKSLPEAQSLYFLYWQNLASYRMDTFTKAEILSLTNGLDQKNLKALGSILASKSSIPRRSVEPRDLFFAQ